MSSGILQRDIPPIQAHVMSSWPYVCRFEHEFENSVIADSKCYIVMELLRGSVAARA